MRLKGNLVNASDELRNDVFTGYTVRITYLVREEERGGKDVFGENTDALTLGQGEYAFHFDLPALADLKADGPLAVSVLNDEDEEVVSRRFDLDAFLRGRILSIAVEGVVMDVPGTPVVAEGRIVVEDDPQRTTGFGGFKVIVAYWVRALPGGPFAPQSTSVTLDDGNGFSVPLPDLERLKAEPLQVEVKYPDGQSATTEAFTIEQLAQPPITLRIKARHAVVLTADTRAVPAEPPRLKGKVVDLAGRAQVANRQVILWGAVPGGAASPIQVATTDANGNFGAAWPPGSYAGAMVTVAGTRNDALEKAVAIELVDVEGSSGRIPRFVYVVVELDELALSGKTAGDCGCDDPGTPRLPDAIDLVQNSSAYSQDIGPNCVNFTIPNRTLEEFTFTKVVRTSEPDIRGTTMTDLEERDLRKGAMVDAVSNASTATPHAKKPHVALSASLAQAMGSLSKLQARQFERHVAERGSIRNWNEVFKLVPGRAQLTGRNSVDWDGTPTFYQATSIAHGHILFYKQRWKADGYSLGDLLYSLPLAPGQKKQIVMFDWDRTEYGRRDESSREDESLDAYLDHDRDIIDIVRGSVREHVDGDSYSHTSGDSGGFGAGFLGAVGGLIGIGGGVSSSSGTSHSTSSQDSSRETSTRGLSQLRDMVQQGASAVRNQRSTVVQTARQHERFKVQTEVVANHNHCHAITMEYFEVLRHYAIEQSLSHVQECLFIPLLMSEFDEQKVVRWMDLLRPALRHPRQRRIVRHATGSISYQDKSLASAFDAVERRVYDYEGVDFPATTYAAEKVLDMSGDILITLSLNRPKDKEDEVADNPIDEVAWSLFGDLLKLNVPTIFHTFFAKLAQNERDRVFEQEIAPKIAEAFVDSLGFVAIDKDGNGHELPLDATLISHYARGVPLYVSIRPTMAELPVTREQIAKLVIYTEHDLSASANSRIIVTSGTVRYRTKHFDGVLFSSSFINNDLKSATIPLANSNITVPLDNVVLYTPLSSEELRNPKHEDQELANRLLRHLNANIEYYHKAIWAQMDRDRRYMLLDGFVAPNSGGKSVASVVENRVIGIAGNSLIMPVAPGHKLDPSYAVEREGDVSILDEDGNVIHRATSLLEHYAPITPVEPFRVSVPTRGVFAEAVMGACNSCEKKDETRFWRWEESPNPDEPTPIGGVQTAPPQRTEPGDLRANAFPAPMINIQNAPATPEPGSLVGGVLGLLGKADVFRDATGLAQTQSNALQAMLSNQESAKHYADKAAELVTLAANQQNGNTTIENIKKSIADKTLDPEAGKRLIENAYRAQIDGKTPPASPVSTANGSNLSTAAADAVRQGREVKALQSHPDGTQTSVEQKAGPPQATDGATVIVQLQRPERAAPGLPEAWVPIAVGQGPGFAKFDHAFTSDGTMPVPGYPDEDSGRFRIAVTDMNAGGAERREVQWRTTFDAAGNDPADTLANATIILTRDTTQPGLLVSAPLILVAETEDLPLTLPASTGAPVASGDPDYRARRAGMFCTMMVEDAGRTYTFPILGPSQRSDLPFHVFLLRQGATPAISVTELAAHLRNLQIAFEPYGIFLNAHPYEFSAAQIAKFNPSTASVGAEVKYVYSEIEVPVTSDVTRMGDTELENLGIELAPNVGGPVIRVFFLADFAVNAPPPAGARVAMAMNASYVDATTRPASDKEKLKYSLYVAGHVQGTLTEYPNAIAHEFGHLMMDKWAKLGAAAPTGDDHYHFTSPGPGFPLEKNLMQPTTTASRAIDQPKRIWDVVDADGYNWLEDLLDETRKLQIAAKS